MAGGKIVKSGTRGAVSRKPRSSLVGQRGGIRRAAVPVQNSTSFTTAPASVGAISRGVEPRIVYGPDGATVYGEDYVFTASGLNSINTTWATVGGFPVSPYSVGSNTLSDLCRSYGESRFERLAVCYIPAVGTSANGQVALYRKTDRLDPHIDPTTAGFYSFVLNQRTGIVGPVWQPMSIEVSCSNDWRSTVPLLGVDANDDADGEVFLATNNNVATGSSPPVGIVKIMYVCKFRGMKRNPRIAILPVPNQVYFNFSIGQNGLVLTAGQVAIFDKFGSNQDGSTTVLPSTSQIGNVYKFVIDLGRSAFAAGPNASTLLMLQMQTNININLTNAYTFYMLQTAQTGGISLMTLHPTFAAAMSNVNHYRWQSGSGGAVFSLGGMASLVGNNAFNLISTI